MNTKEIDEQFYYEKLAKNALKHCVNGYHFCDCGSRAIIAKEEVSCVVCKLKN